MPTDDQLEKIVNAVLAQLGKRAEGGSHSSPTAASSTAAKLLPSNIGASSTAELVIGENVVSAATLADRLANVQRVVVSARAVVTPSARDLLKQRNITLVRALKVAALNSVRLVLGSAGVNIDTTEILRSLRQHEIEVEQLPAVGLQQLTSELAEEVGKNGKLAVLLTGNVPAALCIANRHRGVRAATANNRGELNDVIRAVGANFLVVDAVRRGRMELQRTIELFALAPSHQCPAELKPSLE